MPGSPAAERLLRALADRSHRKLAIFLGAGASKPFGYPLTRELMFAILEGLKARKILTERGSRKRRAQPEYDTLLAFLGELMPGERPSDRVPSVTSVLSLLDYSLNTGQALLAGRTIEETRSARRLLERALLEVIPDEEWFTPDEEDRFDVFAGLLRRIRDLRPAGGLGLITTNYDMLVDLAAIYAAEVDGEVGKWSFDDLAGKVDYGFRWLRADTEEETLVDRPSAPRISIFKLHGSTNWLRCPLCENLYVNPNGPIAWDAFTVDADNKCHCSKTRLVPQIVSPSFVREMRDPNLAAVWKSALDLLREAEHWVIIGYSFPDEDVAIRALFTRAIGSRPGMPRISVVQPDDRARLSYEGFFPEHSIDYLSSGFEDLLSCVR